jgi:hypothetical protein
VTLFGGIGHGWGRRALSWWNDVYLVQIKSPAESKGEWDLFKLVAVIPGDKAFRPLAEGGCPTLEH